MLDTGILTVVAGYIGEIKPGARLMTRKHGFNSIYYHIGRQITPTTYEITTSRRPSRGWAKHVRRAKAKKGIS